jgi:hypothetical protein
MATAAAAYQSLIARARIAFDVEEEPRVFFSPADAWTNCTVRYLVDARKRRRMASDLIVSLSATLADATHRDRIVAAYPRSEVRLRRTWDPHDPAARPAT